MREEVVQGLHEEVLVLRVRKGSIILQEPVGLVIAPYLLSLLWREEFHSVTVDKERSVSCLQHGLEDESVGYFVESGIGEQLLTLECLPGLLKLLLEILFCCTVPIRTC